MKKNVVIAVVLGLVLLVACGGNGDATDGIQEDYDYGSQDMPDWSNYPIIINGIGITDNFFIPEGDIFPTHVPLFPVANALELDVIQGGSQIAIQQDGEGLAFLSVVNYLASEEDRVDVSPNDAFMADDGYFTIYVPIALFREMGFGAYFAGGHIYINTDAGDME